MRKRYPCLIAHCPDDPKIEAVFGAPPPNRWIVLGGVMYEMDVPVDFVRGTHYHEMEEEEWPEFRRRMLDPDNRNEPSPNLSSDPS